MVMAVSGSVRLICWRQSESDRPKVVAVTAQANADKLYLALKNKMLNRQIHDAWVVECPLRDEI